MAEARVALRAEQPALDPARLVFIDESGFTTNMTRKYGRAPVGERLVDQTPHGHWKTTTFVAALRFNAITAPLTLDGPMNGDTFIAWVEQSLAPTLKPGDIVFMDNLSSHKVEGVAEAIRAVGATLRYLPPYSPDLNPIEQVFAKFKAIVRKAKPRSIKALWRTIGGALKRFSPKECAAYLANSGYSN